MGWGEVRRARWAEVEVLERGGQGGNFVVWVGYLNSRGLEDGYGGSLWLFLYT